MTKSEFYDIVNMDNVRIAIPQTSHFSVGTSPYYAHQHGLAIDIYHNLTLENYDVISPISGKILKIKTLKAPKPKFSNGVDIDYLILVSNPSNSDISWKIMHIKPEVKVGDQIEIGDPIGKTIRNGYFAYWSSAHLHLEIRPFNDAIRARGGKTFSLLIEKKDKIIESSEKFNTKQISVEIDSIYPEIILARFPKIFYHKLFPIYGVKVRGNHLDCILDGGIPHYKIGTVLFQKELNFKTKPSIYLGSTKIGTLHETSGQLGFFKFDKIKFLLNNKEIRGISLYLANFFPLIKIIPYSKNEFSFKPNSIQNLKLVLEEKF
ncbi:MAG: hypothetical protein JSV23_06720 [Promethearchaeota archaeon]|nr:MAG: hypothetical protein JSV23_06720 [Candidatus Lokiarchaeota archaeon]